MKIVIIVLAAAALAAAVTCLAGCVGHKQQDPPVCGGVTDKTDPKAPKTIKSKDIASLKVNIIFTGERVQKDGYMEEFSFAVAKDKDGALTASEKTTGVSLPADKALLDKLQEVIDSAKLAERNGVYRVTAGLPPIFSPQSFTAVYASGEKLTFTENNDPDAEWCEQLYGVFADWFASKGENGLKPLPEKERPAKE
ncbi:MAG: hypothetical protein IK083_10620 [Abditibacteriota bacterium]|nr:hypothetical protein [Abditibacteriota bacterium]